MCCLLACLDWVKSSNRVGVRRIGWVTGVPQIEYRFAQYAYEALRRAQLTTLRISIAIVIDPTPPGTGVIFDARALTPSKSTSPTAWWSLVGDSRDERGEEAQSLETEIGDMCSAIVCMAHLADSHEPLCRQSWR